MVSAIRQARKDRQKKHIPSKKAWDRNSNQWIDNPEIKKEQKKHAVPSRTNKKR